MKQLKLKICDVTVHPGEVANLALPLPERYSCVPLYMPIKVLHGVKKGPCIVVFSTLKGDELNGIEIVNRLIKETNIDWVSGTIIAIPVLNVYGLTHFPSMLPSGHKLADCFPGKDEGSFGERFAHIFTQEILTKADYCIELQTGDLNHNILPQVYCNFVNGRNKELAKAFQAPVVTNVEYDDNPLRKTVEELNIPFLVYEAGEARRFDENAIMVGVKGVRNVLRAIDVLPKEPIAEIDPIFSRNEAWILAHKGGILHSNVSLGQLLQKGEMIGEITDPFGADYSEKLTSPREGIVVGKNSTPLLHEGMPIFKIASFLDYDRAESTIEQWDKKQPDSFLG